jgi:hypothetical protein
MVQISDVTRVLCGVILITVPTIEFGGLFLLKMLRTRETGYMDNPIHQSLFRAGHAHAVVIVILALVCLLLDNSTILSEPLAWIARIGAPAAAILIPAGFFLSVASPQCERPNRAIQLVYVGAVTLAISMLILGCGLIRAGMIPGRFPMSAQSPDLI